MIAITGATGQLGTLVVEGLLHKVPANQIIAVVRTPAKARRFAEKGVQIREADYSVPHSLDAAFAGVAKVLLISGNEIGQRVSQHKAVIDAAKAAGVHLLAYTSLLRADTSKLLLAAEHLATEQYLRASGIAFILLRNGWYWENLTAGIATALERGSFIGASKDGRFAAALRAEYAEAAVAVLTGQNHENKVYELAGDSAFTRTDLAAEVSRQAERTTTYRDLPESEYERILASFLPPELARVLADADRQSIEGAIDDHTHTLSTLIGHKTKPLAQVVADALKVLKSLRHP